MRHGLRIGISNCVAAIVFIAAVGCGDTLKGLHGAAEEGDPIAQFKLGLMYDEGQGVPENKVEAVRWYRKAAEQGNSRAQNNLGWMFLRMSLTGDDVRINRGKAFQWFKRAAEQGNVSAQVNLGRMYADGWGTAVDFGEAVKWYRRAAEQGDPMGFFNLAFTYGNLRFGSGGTNIELYKWYALAASRLREGNEKMIATSELSRLRSEMTPAQIREAERQTRAFRPKLE